MLSSDGHGSSCGLIDLFGRQLRYLRLSVMDRCDLRCVYCMSERMAFMPRKDLLSLEELERLACAFIRCGVNKVRITGGEPLVRKDIMKLFAALASQIRKGGLRELTLTTNGTRLAHFADELIRCGVRRVNVSLDTLDPERYRSLTRGGSLASVLDGIDAARSAGLAVKINVIALRDSTETEVDDRLRFANDRGRILTFIETMPLGDIDVDRIDQYLPLDQLRKHIESRWTLSPLQLRTGARPAMRASPKPGARSVSFLRSRIISAKIATEFGSLRPVFSTRVSGKRMRPISKQRCVDRTTTRN